MSNFEKAILLNLFEETNDLPEFFEHYEHTKPYKKSIEKLFDRMRDNKLHIFTKRTAVIILVAAIILLLCIVGFAAIVQREFNIRPFSNHFEYVINDKKNVGEVTDLTVGYIPEGFVLESEEALKSSKYKKYVCGDLYIEITKLSINSYVDFDSNAVIEKTEINGITYIYTLLEEKKIQGVIWNTGNYIYEIDGNIPKKDLLEIAQHIK